MSLRIFFHRFDHRGGRVFRREPRGVFRHLLQLCRIADQFADLSRQQIAGSSDSFSRIAAPAANENLRIARLMIVGRVGKRNQDAGSAKAASSARLAAPERAIAKSAAL